MSKHLDDLRERVRSRFVMGQNRTASDLLACIDALEPARACAEELLPENRSEMSTDEREAFADVIEALALLDTAINGPTTSPGTARSIACPLCHEVVSVIDGVVVKHHDPLCQAPCCKGCCDGRTDRLPRNVDGGG